ncbi:MAG: MoaD/ThiS family protein [Cyanobacteriota bacterium]|jgi:molybdopterin synthase sulfur carrier subunit
MPSAANKPPIVETAPIRILLFASLREQAGWAERCWSLASSEADGEPLTPRRIWQTLGLPGTCDSLRVAINQQFADAETVLRPGDELAFLPPISGG